MRPIFWMALATLVYGCGGGGGGTSDPAGTGGTLPFPATLASIQEKVFSPTCAQGCHEPGGEGVINTGISGGTPLDLSSTVDSFSSLVNVESTIDDICGATLTEFGASPCGDRVEPGEPDRSWLIVKLEGTHERIGREAGDRMPRSGPLLTQDEIDVIRQWIEEGAQNN